MALAFFDLDGTLTRFDTFLLYSLIALIHRPRRICQIHRILKAFIGFGRGRIDRQQFKETFITGLLGGSTRREIARWNSLFSRFILPLILRERVLNRLREHQARGDRVYIVSASPDVYIEALVRQWRLNGMICTNLEWQSGRLTGKIAGKNCRGEEKARRMKTLFSERELKKSYAYGNSEGDKQMLELVGTGLYL
jgi:phosphatidylglycerophosphatase C